MEAALGAAGTARPAAGARHLVDRRRRAAPPAPSAVLVALFEEAGEARTVLTRRSSGLRAHAGEVSFPGGRIDPGESPLEAARREAAEEVGLDPAAVRPAGWLRPLATFSSMSLIVPVVAVLDRRPSLSANEAEVARVFDVALADLVADGAFSEERWTVPGRVAGAPATARPTGRSRCGSSRWPQRRSGAPPPASSSSWSAWCSG